MRATNTAATSSLNPDRIWRRSLATEMKRFAAQARGRRLRSRIDFAQEFIVIPEGPYEGEHWRPHFQPYTYHALRLMDTCGLRKFRFTGCVQSGKTFLVVINTLYHLFERRESVIYGVPDVAETGADKWREELKPVIDAHPALAAMLPSKGRGSKGGTATALKFKNGATLRFMGGSGGDHRRSHFTAPVVVKTEVDRYDQASEASRESPPVEQMEARTEAFKRLGRDYSYEECTVTTEQGRIWTELERSTMHRLYVRCVDCRKCVYPTREDLIGVEDATDVDQAADEGAFKCPECGVLWSDSDRLRMVTVEGLIPVAKGQKVKIGSDGSAVIEGELPKTDRLGFSWHTFHNLFHSMRDICRDEWNALYSKNPDEAELKRRQFAWTIPAEPTEFDLTPLTIADVVNRKVDGLQLGDVPNDTTCLSCGVDIRKRELHFVVRAWTKRHGVVAGHVVDMGTLAVDSDNAGVRKAVVDALVAFREHKILRGYGDDAGQVHFPAWTLVDAGWKEGLIWLFMLDCAQKGIKGIMPILGRGQSAPPGTGAYRQPEKISDKIPWIGDQCYVRRSDKYLPLWQRSGVMTPPHFVFANSDEWKTFVRDGYATPSDQPGALTTFKPTTIEETKMLREYARQTTAEKLRRKLVPGRGVVDVYENISNKPNHLGDCDYYSAVAGFLAGVRVDHDPRMSKASAAAKPLQGITMPDGRPLMEVHPPGS